MPVTPDRRPGALEEDKEIKFTTSNGAAPSGAGALTYDPAVGSFKLQDGIGVFNPRGGGLPASATDGQALIYGQTPNQWTAGDVQNLAGHASYTDATLAWNDATRTFTISGTYSFYINNIKFTKSSPLSVTIPNVVGLYFIYFDSTGTLVQSTTPWEIGTALAAPTATIYWTGTLGEMGDERHGAYRNRILHSYLHATRGAAYDSGLSGTFTNNSLSITQGYIWDEDIRHSIPLSTSTRVWYYNASNQMQFFNNQSAPYYAVGGVLRYNNAGTLTAVGNNNYITNWVYATNDPTAPISTVISAAQYGTIANARAASQPTFPNLTVREWKLLYEVIYRNVGGNATFVESSDYRSASQVPSIGTSTLPATSVTYVPTGDISSTTVQGAISELDSEAVKYDDLITFIDQGPVDSYATGATKTTTGGAFPTEILWKRADGTNLVKQTITYTGVLPTTVKWELYAVNGTTITRTVTDTVTYSGAYEVSRTRSIV